MKYSVLILSVLAFAGFSVPAQSRDFKLQTGGIRIRHGATAKVRPRKSPPMHIGHARQICDRLKSEGLGECTSLHPTYGLVFQMGANCPTHEKVIVGTYHPDGNGPMMFDIMRAGGSRSQSLVRRIFAGANLGNPRATDIGALKSLCTNGVDQARHRTQGTLQRARSTRRHARQNARH